VVSVLAGVALVYVTFMLARHLFDYRVAALSALLLALTPFSIEVSQVARAYALTALFALASLYWFSRLRTPHTPARRVWLYAIFTLLALFTHYLVGVVVVVQNLIVLALALLGRLPRRQLLAWVKLQAVMGLVSLPLIWMALQRVPQDPGSTSGQGWLAAPNASGMAKALILWATGDPSFGPAGVTPLRLASLVVVVALLALGVLTAWQLWRTRPDRRLEVRHIAFVAAAFFGTWGTAVGISFVRKIFHEKYFVYLAPLLIILLVWSALRLRPALLGRGLLAVLAGLIGVSLYTFYSAPNGEQWREAMAYVSEQRQPNDYVVTAPGFYIRPVSYYLNGALPADDQVLPRAPYALAGPQGYVAADDSRDDRGLPDVDVATAPAGRVWLITGYNPLDASRLDWFYNNYEVASAREFLGVAVILGVAP
jgi:4-amino-4-deoxy-L-arabinose transferase-like glycosyltransferase